MNFFSSNIKILRKHNGLRQAEIQERLGITRTTWSNYETGVSQPSIEGLIAIAKFFSVSVSDLLEREMIADVSNQTSVVRKRNQRYNRSLLKRNVTSLLPPLGGKGVWERTTTW